MTDKKVGRVTRATGNPRKPLALQTGSSPEDDERIGVEHPVAGGVDGVLVGSVVVGVGVLGTGYPGGSQSPL